MGGFVDEVAADDELMTEALLQLWAERGEIDAGVIAALENEGRLNASQERELARAWDDAVAQTQELNASQRREVAQEFADLVIGQVSLTDKLNLGLFDLLWFGLAVVTAFRVAAGVEYD
ncbi:MAG: hypothetical protein GY898_10535 [Proteobacteria bacterium]|nr:hypothetical protein [Pseudomonadota bacterium]